MEDMGSGMNYAYLYSIKRTGGGSRDVEIRCKNRKPIEQNLF